MERTHPDPNHPEDCFGCKLVTIGWQFSYGQEQFHGPTLRERAEKQIEEAKSVGLDPQPVGERWI